MILCVIFFYLTFVKKNDIIKIQSDMKSRGEKMRYYIYGKRNEPVWNARFQEWEGPDNRFAALTKNGVRSHVLSEAVSFSSFEEAKDFLHKQILFHECSYEIRCK